MMRRYLACLFMLAVGGVLAALDWPLADKTILSLFGEEKAGHFTTGIELAGEDQPVASPGNGTVVFCFETDANYETIPSGLGNFVAVEYDDNLMTVFGHLKNGSIPFGRKRVSHGDTVGITGSTGYCTSPRLSFQMLDRKEGQYVNPLSFMPPLDDKKPPAIKRIYVDQGSGPEPLDTLKKIRTGRIQLLADIFDQSERMTNYWPLAVYSIEVYYNGNKRFQLVNEVIKENLGRMEVMPEAPLAVTDVYAPDGKYRLGFYDLSRGRANFEIVCKDFVGNQRVSSVVIPVED